MGMYNVINTNRRQIISKWGIIFTFLISSTTFAFPDSTGFVPVRGAAPARPHYLMQYQQQPAVRIERKFAEKPNSIKKVQALDDLDDIQTNQISDNSGGGGGGFSWSNILGMLMQMIFNPGGGGGGGGGVQSPSKSESLDDNGVVTAPSSPWANLLTVGLKILSALLGGGTSATNDGIDKVDNGSPMQGILVALLSALVGSRDPQQVNMMAKQAGELINIVVNLLDALKTSFSHRSLAARHMGRRDSVSDAAIASITMFKGYMRSMSTSQSVCMQKFMCQANTECSTDIGTTSLYCHLGNYAASLLLDKSPVVAPPPTNQNMFDFIYEAGRRGRTGENCQQAYLACNEV